MLPRGRKETEPFYNTQAWRRLRKLVIMRDRGMCYDCMRRFEMGYGIKPRRAVLVHHVIPYKERPDLALDENNLVALCSQCHEERHPERRAGVEKKEASRNTGIRIEKV